MARSRDVKIAAVLSIVTGWPSRERHGDVLGEVYSVLVAIAVRVRYSRA